MAKTIVSVSFSNGFVGDATKTNESSASSYLKDLGWSNFQFQQATDNGRFGGTQGNDLAGTILITDAAGVQHRIDGAINWRAPSGDVTTIVFFATGTTNHTLAVAGGGTKVIDPYDIKDNDDPHSFVGLTFNGQTLVIDKGQVSGNAATKDLISSLNSYLDAQPQLSVGDVTVNEDARSATVTVKLSKGTADTVTVDYETQDGTARTGADYTARKNTLVFSAYETSKTFTVPLVDNATVDGTRSFDVVLSNSSFAAIVDNTGIVTINDNDGAPAVPAAPVVLDVTPVEAGVVEGAALAYTVRLSGAGGGEFALAVGGSTSAADRGAIGFSEGVSWKNGSPASGVVLVPAGVSSFKVTVATVDDVLIENTETVVVTVGTVSSTGTVTDNDSQGVRSVLAEDAAHTGANPVDATVTEGAALLYTVALKGASPYAVELTLVASGTAGRADVGTFEFSNGVAWKDNNAQGGVVIVPANVSAFTVTVPTQDDSAVESVEDLLLTVGGVGGPGATGTIADNDSIAVVSVLAEDAAHAGTADNAVVEGGTLRYTVALSATTIAPAEFRLAVGGSAADADHAALVFSDGVRWKDGSAGIVVVPAGLRSFTIDVATIDDGVVEAAESLTIAVGGVTGTGGITDNDAVSVAAVVAEDAASAGLASATTTVTEGAALRYTVQLSGAGVAATEFQLGFGGSATAADRAAIGFSDGVAWKGGSAASGTIVVPAHLTSFTITVATTDDDEIELGESLVATVGGVAATGTILDNDGQSVASVKAGTALPDGATVAEGADLLFAIAFDRASPAPTEHRLALGGSASGADLGTLTFDQGVSWKGGQATSGIVLVPAGVRGFTATLPTLDDTLVEAAETAVLTVGGVSATGTIVDNDSLAVLSVAVGEAVREGGPLQYTVTLNGASPGAAEFALALGGTASAADIGALAFGAGAAWKNDDSGSGMVVLAPGVRSFTVTVPTLDDTQVESTESLVLVVGGVRATGSVLDNDVAPPAVQPAPPVQSPPPGLETGLDPATDDGASNSDTVTSMRTPEFTLQGSLLAEGGSVRLLAPGGEVAGSTAITAADVAAGKINVAPGALDDGVYSYTAQVLDAAGKVVASAQVAVTVVTDLDGVTPSIELAAHGGDFNHDGVLDWQQHTVAHMPLRSLADFALGKDAPVAAFGAVMAGSLGTADGDVQLTSGAQLKDLSLTDLPSALSQELRAASPVFNFTVGAEADVPSLPDMDARAGLQTRVVIDLGANGAVANDFMKFDKASGTWYSFLDDQDLSTMDDGATLVDLNNDGRVDRIVLTLTDGARGDDDGIANGTIVDPGLLAFDTTVPKQVYSVRLADGETYYTADVDEAHARSAGTGNVFEGVAFDAMDGAPDARHVSAYYQPFTHDLSYARDGQPLPYACFEVVTSASGFAALAAGKAAVDIHLYQDARGLTELVSTARAQELGLAAKGYADRGAQFSVSMDNAFEFDAEGYLIANQENAAVQALVRQLAGTYQSTGAAGFIEAVEQNYFEQIKLVGVAHGAAASAADLNAVFGTAFGS